MTGIMIGFTRARHLLGTVYGNYSLTAADTGINAAGPNGGGSGDSTITLPATPSTNQTITINNTGTGTVTVNGNGNNIGASATTTIATLTTKWLVWGGYTWGFVTGTTCGTVTLPATKDFGVTTQGPAETPYSVPADTVTYETIGYTPCGGLLRKTITTTYSARSELDAVKVIMSGYHNAEGSTPLLDINGTFNFYGATSIIARDAAQAYAITVYPTTANFTGFPNPWTLNTTATTYLTGWYSYGEVEIAGALYYASLVSETLLDLYYLDTHIVWTYEII